MVRARQQKSRLDRTLVNSHWASFGNWTSFSLPRKNFDHKPIKLFTSSSDWGPKSFKFLNCWLEDVNLMSNLELIWQNSKPKLNLGARFKDLKEFTRSWNTHQFGNIHQKIKAAEKEQEVADILNKDKVQKLEIKLKLEELYKLKSSMLCQKARVNWNLKGEKNTNFFFIGQF